MSRRRDNGGEEERMEAEGAAENGTELPERWSVRRKSEVVLRLLKGEDIGSVSRETQVPVHELETWRRVFLESGTTGLRRHGNDGSERELKRAQAKVGELTMQLEVLEWLLEKRVRGGVAEVAALQGTVSVATGKPYRLQLLCTVLRVPRLSVYGARAGRPVPMGAKRGPKSPVSDEHLLDAIHAVLAACPFHSEGHRKVHARLRHQA